VAGAAQCQSGCQTHDPRPDHYRAHYRAPLAEYLCAFIRTPRVGRVIPTLERAAD
jgi:hypothetical protein